MANTVKCFISALCLAGPAMLLQEEEVRTAILIACAVTIVGCVAWDAYNAWRQ